MSGIPSSPPVVVSQVMAWLITRQQLSSHVVDEPVPQAVEDQLISFGLRKSYSGVLLEPSGQSVAMVEFGFVVRAVLHVPPWLPSAVDSAPRP